MKLPSFITLALIALIAALSVQTPPPTPQSAPPTVRALWVVRTTLTSPEAVKQMVSRARANDFTDLIVQVRGRGDAYYKPRWEPRASELSAQPAEFDPLALAISEAHRAGLRVHAWINTFLVANMDTPPVMTDHALYRHPEWLMLPRPLAAQLLRLDPKSEEFRGRLIEHARGNRGELEGLYLSPAHPAVREHIYSIWIDLLERYDVDGLHFDYVRYPSPQFDYSRSALERFRAEVVAGLGAGERQLLDRLAASDPLVYATTFPERYAQFQRDQVTQLVERIYYGVKARKPQVAVSAAVFANDEDAYERRFQDWKTWLRRGLLDIVCPMAYTPDTETFRKQIAVAVGAASGRRVWSGIGAYRQPVEATVEKIRVARELGAQGFVLFSYDSTVRQSENNPEGRYLERVREALSSSQ